MDQIELLRQTDAALDSLFNVDRLLTGILNNLFATKQALTGQEDDAVKVRDADRTGRET